MQLRQVRDFLAVIEAGSLRAAARSLGISQPAMTKSIRQLEEELHVQLLHRSGRGAVATRAGKVVLARARVVQAELKGIEADLEQLRGERTGTVVIGVSPATSVLLVPEALVRFGRQYPRATVRLVEGRDFLLPMIREATLDFAIGPKSARKLDSAIHFKPVYRTSFVIAGRRGHPLHAARTLRDLAQASWVTFTARERSGLLYQIFSDAGLPPPKSIVQCESYTTAMAVLASTDALGMLVPQVLAGPYAHGFLQQIRIKEQLPSMTLGMFRRIDTPLTPAASEMATAIMAVGRKLMGVSR